MNVKSTVQSCVGKATSWLSGLGGSSKVWGGDMISGFANGISENMWKVAGQVKNAANLVASCYTLHDQILDLCESMSNGCRI